MNKTIVCSIALLATIIITVNAAANNKEMPAYNSCDDGHYNEWVEWYQNSYDDVVSASGYTPRPSIINYSTYKDGDIVGNGHISTHIPVFDIEDPLCYTTVFSRWTGDVVYGNKVVTYNHTFKHSFSRRLPNGQDEYTVRIAQTSEYCEQGKLQRSTQFFDVKLYTVAYVFPLEGTSDFIVHFAATIAILALSVVVAPFLLVGSLFVGLFQSITYFSFF